MKINKEKLLKIGIPVLVVLGIGGFLLWKKRISLKAEVSASPSEKESTAEVKAEITKVTSPTQSSPALPGQVSKVVAPINTGVVPPKITTAVTTALPFTQVLEYTNAALPATDKRLKTAKFILAAPNKSFKVGQKVIVNSKNYNGETEVWYVWNNQHIFTMMPFKGSEAGTIKIK